MSSANQLLLEAKNVTKYFGTITALENVNLKIHAGECLGVVGCLLYTSPSPRDGLLSRMPSSA